MENEDGGVDDEMDDGAGESEDDWIVRRRFRCRNRPCGGKKMGIRSGTFFEVTRLDIAQSLELLYHWCMNR